MIQIIHEIICSLNVAIGFHRRSTTTEQINGMLKFQSKMCKNIVESNVPGNEFSLICLFSVLIICELMYDSCDVMKTLIPLTGLHSFQTCVKF